MDTSTSIPTRKVEAKPILAFVSAKGGTEDLCIPPSQKPTYSKHYKATKKGKII